MKTLNLFLAFLLVCSCSSISTLFQWRKAEASMEDCRRKCGEVDIPYPFGMKEGCYLDQKFEVRCNESTGSATLALQDWEVDRISITNHTLRHKNFSVFAFSFDQSGESTYGHSMLLHLRSNHFTLPHTKNKFVAMGCDFYAYLIDDDTKEFLGGCAPLCNHTDIVSSPSSPCSSLHCCQIDLPKDLMNVSVGIETMNTLAKSWADNCGCFTFLDGDFLRLNKMKSCECNQSYLVPVIHGWAVGNTGCNKARDRGDYVCGKNTECTDYSPGEAYRCKCKNGYQGNPYLPEGCQDIDECGSSMLNNCPKNNRCVNTAGSYFCLPDRRNMLAILIPLGTGIAVGLLILVAISIWTWRKIKKMKQRKMKQKYFKRNGGLPLQQQISSEWGKGIT